MKEELKLEQATQAETATARERGTVRWFDEQKGYGFIQRENGIDVFVHFRAIQAEGFKTLQANAVVEFEVKDGPKGKFAENVVVV